MINPIKSFFLFSSGATGSILKMDGCEVDHNKYAGIGATIFFTAVLASLSGGYAMFTVFREARLAAAFGLFWGLIIFNLDRFIVSSLRKRRPDAQASPLGRAALKADELLKASPRLILAVFISVVITRPIELKLFESEIRGQITKDLTLERTRVEEGIRAEYADIEKSEQDLAKLRERQVQLEDEVSRRLKVATGELQGWSGTIKPGDGPEYKRRLAEVEHARRELDTFNKQYGPVMQASATQIGLRKQERDGRVAEAKGAVDQSPGLLKRLEAFNTLTTSHTSMLLASCFIVLLFISLETAPILVKLFSGRGPYDDHLDAIEHKVYASRQKEMSDLNDDINTAVALGKQLNAGRLQAELQLSQNTMAALHTLAPQEFQEAQVEIAKRAITHWRNAQLNRLNHTPPGPPPPPVTPSAPGVAHAAQNPPPGPAPAGVAAGAAAAAPPMTFAASGNSGGVHTSANAHAQTAAPHFPPPYTAPPAAAAGAHPSPASPAAQGASAAGPQASSGPGSSGGGGGTPPPPDPNGNNSTP